MILVIEFFIALLIGTLVTKWLHSKINSRMALSYSYSFWNRRIGTTTLRYANIPVFGLLFALSAIVFNSDHLAAISAGAGLSAFGYGIIHPLPKIDKV
jgi:hypothetical protein